MPIFHLPFPISAVSRFPFPFLRSWFYQFPSILPDPLPSLAVGGVWHARLDLGIDDPTAWVCMGAEPPAYWRNITWQQWQRARGSLNIARWHFFQFCKMAAFVFSGCYEDAMSLASTAKDPWTDRKTIVLATSMILHRVLHHTSLTMTHRTEEMQLNEWVWSSLMVRHGQVFSWCLSRLEIIGVCSLLPG